MPQLERLMAPDHGTYFTREELSRVRVEPVGESFVFYCNRCQWNIMRSGVGPFLPWEVAHDGARAVVDHWREVGHR